MAGSRCTSFGVRVSRKLDYPTVNRQTDRWTDKHYGNRVKIRSTSASRANKDIIFIAIIIITEKL